MKTFTTSKGEFILVPVPEDAHSFEIDNHQEHFQLLFKANFKGLANIGHLRPLPPGQWELIGQVWELTEDEWSEVVDKEVSIISWDENKDSPNVEDVPATESGLSLMTSLQVYQTNPLPKPEYQHDEHGNGGYCEAWVKEFEEAQQHVGNYLLLKKAG